MNRILSQDEFALRDEEYIGLLSEVEDENDEKEYK